MGMSFDQMTIALYPLVPLVRPLSIHWCDQFLLSGKSWTLLLTAFHLCTCVCIQTDSAGAIFTSSFHLTACSLMHSSLGVQHLVQWLCSNCSSNYYTSLQHIVSQMIVQIKLIFWLTLHTSWYFTAITISPSEFSYFMWKKSAEQWVCKCWLFLSIKALTRECGVTVKTVLVEDFQVFIQINHSSRQGRKWKGDVEVWH